MPNNLELKEIEEKKINITAQLLEQEDNFNLTEEQINKVLNERSKINDYIREEKKDKHTEFKIKEKNKLHFLYCFIILVIILSILVLFFAKEYFTELLTFLITAPGAYGFGKYQGIKEFK